MNKVKIGFLLLFCAVIFFSCVDTEEYITVNADHSGSYTVKMDMSKLIELANQFGNDKSFNRQPMPRIDTLVYFKDMETDKLTVEEKELYLQGYFKMKVDSASNECRIEIGCPFKNIAQLPEIRKHLFDISEKLGLNNITGDKNKSAIPGAAEAIPGNGDLGSALNPSGKEYDFFAAPGKISCKSNKPADTTHLANDSMMQMMQQLTMLTGEMTLKTIITLPHAPKKISNSKAVLSADGKTVTISNTITDLMEKPEEGEYEIEY